jgi:hypothetical protein
VRLASRWGRLAANQHLQRLVAHLVPHALDLPLGDHVAVREQDHPVRDAIHLVQDVAGDDDVEPVGRQRLEQGHGLGAGHGIEAV